MSDETTITTTEEEVQEEQPTQEEPQNNSAEPQEVDENGDPIRNPAEYWRVRYEAANRILGKYESVAEAKSPEELRTALETAQQEARQARINEMRLRYASEFGIPSSHQKYITGETEEDIRASAEQVKADFTPPAPQFPVDHSPGSPAMQNNISLDYVDSLDPNDPATAKFINDNWEVIKSLMAQQSES
jgi:hypothetical protein